MISAIVAVDENFGIGFNGDLLEHIPEDLKHFKELTSGHNVVMGRKTWDSLPKKPLPNRHNLVITKDPSIYELTNEVNTVISSKDRSFEVTTIFNLSGRGLFGKDSHVFLPIIIVLFVVNCLKRFKSSGICSNRSPLKPIPKFSSTATIAEIIFLTPILIEV